VATGAHFAFVRVLGAYQPVATALPLPAVITGLKLKGGNCSLAGALSGAASLGTAVNGALQ